MLFQRIKSFFWILNKSQEKRQLRRVQDSYTTVDDCMLDEILRGQGGVLHTKVRTIKIKQLI